MFNYESKTEKYINKEIDLRVGELTSQGLIKSEQEYKKVIEDLLSALQLDFGRITNPRKYLAIPDEVVSSLVLNNFFKDIESDIRILYQELSDSNKILGFTFNRNKVFFRHIKDKIEAMWKEIGHFRETSFNVESGDYTFFESFDSDMSSMVLSGLTVDKKTGMLHLLPASIKTHNESWDIQDVNVTIFPSDNKDGGVFVTSSPQNDADREYASGDRTMFKSGLWKIQLLTADIPKSVLDPMNAGTTLTYNGILAYLDITFAGPKLINELGIDPYGEFSTNIIGIRYRSTLTDSWHSVTTTNSDGDVLQVETSGKDWIYLRNIDPIHARVIRIIFQQENHTTISKLLSNLDVMTDKIVRDLMEKRYEKSYYNYKFLDEIPRVSDVNEDTGTLYNEIIDAIEEEKDIDNVEGRISELLIPSPTTIAENIQNWKVYNLGAWSIEPKTVIYAPGAVGIYYSHDPRNTNSGFKFDSGAPTEATLYTTQEEPNGTMIEWSLISTIDNSQMEIPILPNNDLFRTEILSFGKYQPLDNITKRTKIDVRNLNQLIKLDFPIHTGYLSEVSIFENGTEILNYSSSAFDATGYLMELYNTSEIYISELNINPMTTYVIKYIPSTLETVQCWVLQPNKNSTDHTKIDIANTMVFANEGMARKFASNLKQLSIANAPSWITKSDDYSVRSHLCTRNEYNEWFLGGRVPIFIDAIADFDTKPGIDWLPYSHGKVYYSAITKLTWLYNSNIGIKPYSDTKVDPYTWNELTSAPPNIHVKTKSYLSTRGQ